MKPFTFDPTPLIAKANSLTQAFVVGVPLKEIGASFVFSVFRVSPARDHLAHFDCGTVIIDGGKFRVDTTVSIRGWAIQSLGICRSHKDEAAELSKRFAQLDDSLVHEACAEALRVKENILLGRKDEYGR